ncbi:RNA polymerase sigma factor [Salinispora cortesiana]|uniref:RNA polymerase sigma factor n=1 Tax=Salinispora cortesiana TaxID=1305843 RepID=UPI00041E88CE|nr:RNA polymerase sigma factor [Salinispora cortesiana]
MAVAESFRQESGRIVAGLIRLTGDWDLAEECTQDAFAEALRTWPETGTPRRPGAWLTTVARNRAYDRLRRASTETAKLHEVAVLADPKGLSDVDVDLDGGSGIRDDRLRLMFTCCHPALPLEARVALTLRTLAGLTTAEIARAFLVPEQTMAKRLVRAKRKIANAAIPYRVPPAHLLPERTSGVLAVLYLLFNEGYSASGGADLAREGLCAEAIRLTRALVELMPGESEPAGLLALMLLQHSRRGARVDRAGNLITLEDQDRGLWHREEVDEATSLLERTLRARRIGPYQLQAAIAACHAEARRAADTNWAEISALYARLAELMPSPIVELNRAVAVAMADGPAAGLVLVDALEASGRLGDYHLLPALRADLLRRLGRRDDAAASYRRALHLTGNDAERRYISRRLDETCDSGSTGSVTATPAERANGSNDQRRWARSGPPVTALC